MARIPDVTDLGQRPVPRSRRGIVSDRSGEILGAGLQNVAGSLGRIQEKQDRFSYAQARSELLQADIDARRELEADPEWSTYEPRYRERMTKAREKAAKNIRTKYDKALFEQDSKLDVERGAAAVHQESKRREGDWGRAALESNLDKNRTAALNAKDNGTRMQIHNTAQDLVAGARDKGYITAEQAAEVQRNYAASFGEGYVTLLPPDERIKVLTNPKNTPADFIAPDKRALLLKAAQHENREVRVRRESQAAEDRIYAEGGSLESMRAQARKIEDPEVRDSTVARVEARVADREADRERHDTALRRQAWDVVLGGGKWEDIPTAVTTTMNPQDGIAIKNYLRVGGGKTVPEAWATLKRWEGDEPARFAEFDLLKFRDQLDEVDFERFSTSQAKIREDMSNADAVRTDNQLVDDALHGMGIKTTARATEKDLKRSAVFRRAFDDRVQVLVKEQGKKPTGDQKNAIIDQLSMEVVTDRGLLFDSTERAFEADEVLEIVVPKEERKKIVKALEKAGETVTDERVQALYLRGKGL